MAQKVQRHQLATCTLYLLFPCIYVGSFFTAVSRLNRFHRADNAMQAYRGALGELREDMQVSPFASWTLEHLQVGAFLSFYG